MGDDRGLGTGSQLRSRSIATGTQRCVQRGSPHFPARLQRSHSRLTNDLNSDRNYLTEDNPRLTSEAVAGGVLHHQAQVVVRQNDLLRLDDVDVPLSQLCLDLRTQAELVSPAAPVPHTRFVSCGPVIGNKLRPREGYR